MSKRIVFMGKRETFVEKDIFLLVNEEFLWVKAEAF